MNLDNRNKPGIYRIFGNAPVCLIVAAVSLILAATLTGCSDQGTEVNSDKQAVTASEYMVKLNQAADSMHEELNSFAESVAAGDTSTLQSKADAAFQAMNSINDLQVPDELAGVRDKYREATDALRNSLNEYIALYTEIQNEPDMAKVDMRKYTERFESVQKEYDRGMNLLEKADAAAKEM